MRMTKPRILQEPTSRPPSFQNRQGVAKRSHYLKCGKKKHHLRQPQARDLRGSIAQVFVEPTFAHTNMGVSPRAKSFFIAAMRSSLFKA